MIDSYYLVPNQQQCGTSSVILPPQPPSIGRDSSLQSLIEAPLPRKELGQSTSSHQSELLDLARAQNDALRQRLQAVVAENGRLTRENTALRQRSNEVQASLNKVQRRAADQ